MVVYCIRLFLANALYLNPWGGPLACPFSKNSIMLHGKAIIPQLAPRLRAGVLRLEQLTRTDFIISVPKKAATIKGPKGQKQATSVRIHQRVNNAKPTKPGEVLNDAAKQVVAWKPEWLEYKAGVFNIVTKQAEQAKDKPAKEAEEPAKEATEETK